MFIVGLYDVINLLPIATVAGVMASIVLHMFQWKSTFAGLLRLRLSDSLTIAAVTAVSVTVNLGIGVLVGVGMQALVFAWDMRSPDNFHVHVHWGDKAEEAGGVTPLPGERGREEVEAVANGDGEIVEAADCRRVDTVRVRVRGVLYFGSVASLLSDCHPDRLLTTASPSLPAPLPSPVDAAGEESRPGIGERAVRVVLDLTRCRVVDYSGCCAVDDALKEWRTRGWTVVLHTEAEQQRMMARVQPITPSRQALTWSAGLSSTTSLVCRSIQMPTLLSPDRCFRLLDLSRPAPSLCPALLSRSARALSQQQQRDQL